MAVDAGGVLAGKTLTQIAAGGVVTCALDSAGAAYCWGDNQTGELGDGTTANGSRVPVAVDTNGVLAGKRLIEITAGYQDVCALDSTGAAYCWGDNENGELGDGGSDSQSGVPVAVDTDGVLAGKTLTQIAAMSSQTEVCALDSAGAAYCWGSGGLGDGSTTYSTVPVAVDTSGVLAGKTLTQITAGQFHGCAVDSAGAAYCWGGNQYGELGDGNGGGSGDNSAVPVAVDTSGALAGKILTQITAGDNNTCALDRDGAAYCWGFNEDGELGDGTTSYDSTVPVSRGHQRRTGRQDTHPDQRIMRAGQHARHVLLGQRRRWASSATATQRTATYRCWSGRRRPRTSWPFPATPLPRCRGHLRLASTAAR